VDRTSSRQTYRGPGAEQEADWEPEETREREEDREPVRLDRYQATSAEERVLVEEGIDPISNFLISHQ
jgi:hypothetical protein